MTRSLLPLNALRAFEASARHLSFTKAAAELNVTPTAVGHQVKALEEFLGVTLFHRLNRALRLTDAGAASLPLLTKGFDRLDDAVRIAKTQVDARVLRVTVAPSLAVKWLVPRLSHFETAFPDITVRVETDFQVVDLAKSGHDLGLRFCAGVAPGLKGERLLGEEVIPICAPRLLQGPRSLSSPKDLCRHILIHLDGESEDPFFATWHQWCERAAVTGINTGRGPRFSQSIAAVQAAIEGQGVALVPRLCVLDDLACGKLVQPFGPGVPTSYAYFIVSPAPSDNMPKVVAFREWLHSEAAATRRAAHSV